MSHAKPLLGVNIDHVASLRQARYRGASATAAPPMNAEPDPARAVHEAELGGAEIITLHLREDRRHVHDEDYRRVLEMARVRVNLEMAATDAMVALALKTKPHMVTLVPEGRQEVTTEGGLDVAGQLSRLGAQVRALSQSGITVSAFIDADAKQVEASGAAGFHACEFHTGPYAEAFARCGGDFRHADLRRALEALREAGHRARAGKMRFHAGHALNYANTAPVAALPGVEELHIGHSIVSRAVFVGLRAAVAEMRGVIASAG